jgi:hypothetical protein
MDDSVMILPGSHAIDSEATPGAQGSSTIRRFVPHQIVKANRGNHKTERQQLRRKMDQKNNRADPDFKDQFREAVETIGDGGTRVPASTAGELLPTAMNRIPRNGGGRGGDPSFKAQIQRGLKSGRSTPPPPGNNDGNDVPIAQAVAVDNSTNNSDGVPVVVPPTPTAQEDSVVMVLKISKRTLYWLL